MGGIGKYRNHIGYVFYGLADWIGMVESFAIDVQWIQDKGQKSMIRLPKGKVPTSEDVKRLRKKIAELKGDVARLERKNDEKLAAFGAMPYRTGMGSQFYSTREWRDLRYEVLRECAAKYQDGKPRCEMCGQKAGEKPLEVDHKKPRSLFPHLELMKENLQVLCNPCNQGKGAKT